MYRAYCVKCQVMVTGDNGYVEWLEIPTYIGETSRPIRERISEHVIRLGNWRRQLTEAIHINEHTRYVEQQT